MKLKDLKLAMAELADDEAEVNIGVFASGQLTYDPHDLILYYRAHPTQAGRGQCLICTAELSLPPEAE
jgi:hypothetical protein